MQSLAEREGMHLSAHLCGEDARQLMRAEAWIPKRAFARYQINGYTRGQVDAAAPDVPRSRFYQLAAEFGVEFILQARGDEAVMDCAHDVVTLGASHASILCDPSGGRGIEPFRWATTPTGVRTVQDVGSAQASGGGASPIPSHCAALKT